MSDSVQWVAMADGLREGWRDDSDGWRWEGSESGGGWLEDTYIKERMTLLSAGSTHSNLLHKVATKIICSNCRLSVSPTMRGLFSQSQMGEREGRGRVSLSQQFWQVPV